MLRAERVSRDLERRRGAIRDVARDLLAREGIAKFTIERVADEAGYARTAIYRFFSAKRDLLAALAIESLELRAELYRHVNAFEGRPRERFVAFGEVTCLLYPRHVLPQVFGSSHAHGAKTERARLERLRALEREDDALVFSVAKEAVAAGDLDLGFGMTLEETLFGLHALTSGIFERMGSLPPPSGVGDPRAVLRRTGSRLLDGLGWRPLTSEWDYRATVARVYDEILTPRLLASSGLHEDPDVRRLRSASGGR